MSDYCHGCHYDKKLKIGEKACPFNSLYWDFYMRHADKLQSNIRLSIVYQQIKKMPAEQKQAISIQANKYLDDLENL
jgi:deoxyribodipyrimidine photolyase-related protein